MSNVSLSDCLEGKASANLTVPPGGRAADGGGPGAETGQSDCPKLVALQLRHPWSSD